MTNSKNHAFLICPANQTGAVGGTPPTRGVIGGQIKKETWEHAFEAALRGLPKAVSGDQALVHCLEPRADKKGGSHRYSHEQVTTGVYCGHSHEDRSNMEGAKCKSSDHLGPLLLCGGLGPVLLPVFGAQDLARDGTARARLKRYAVVWREWPLPCHPRAYVAQVAVPKGLCHCEVSLVVKDELWKRVFKGWASFHASNLT